MLHATYKNLGSLSKVAAETHSELVAHDTGSIWTGRISLSGRVADNQDLAVKVIDALKPSVIDSYFGASDMRAQTRCIDGRISKGYVQATPTLHGPQVPGGTPLAALAWRIVHDSGMQPAMSLEQDISDVVGVFTSRGIGFGGHIDDASHPDGNTGCGAIDLIPQMLQHAAKPHVQQQLRGLTKLLLAATYQEEIVDRLLGRIIALQSVAAKYFSIDKETGIYNYKRTAIELLRKSSASGDSVSRLVGPHHEAALVVNTVPGTTFDRDRFSAEFDGALQLFNYDVWYSQHGATLLYPVATTMPFHQAAQHLRWQYEYITCRVLLAVATLMVLTDGSVQLIVRNGRK